ncbi:SDR family NAD(P)-dependent oxidoreductase [Actinoallomurus spadix]|uniref:SDR family NAD(P)-dependent oxidoreductase n=1 Tax=Actinoallomurus spadix TaxID=79912 RepID=UPI0020923652|nr:SDR family oxidoreductase [Actinoallomurus spadix]MCO5988074.1 SDR family NAD(P)-dependent oxidoreductase [Actinoallomurus spadix]
MVVDPGPPDARPAAPGDAELDACLRVLAQARETHPDDPRWAAVHEAAAQLYRAGKKTRKAMRTADRRRRDREVMAASARFREQDPSPDPDPVENRPAGSARPAPPLTGTRRCYVCKIPYRQVHPEYHLLCPACAEQNTARRHARCDLRGRRAVVTGGRVKIGFQLALKLLRDGAEVLVTTRFPRDAARRFAAVPDAADWLDRLHVHGVDLLDLAAVAHLLDTVHDRFPFLDILVNNAAQTIRRPAAYHREVRDAEAAALTGLAARIDVTDARPALAPARFAPEIPALPGTAAAGLPAPVTGAPTGAAGGALANDETIEALFPSGATDETGQPLDLRDRNSWSLRLHEVDPAEWLEVQMVNSFAPFLLTSRLRGLLEASPWPDRYVVQVSAMEGSFSRGFKTVRHPHTNMAKAALNMLTRTSAADYAASGIYMTSVDTGWVTDERPHPDKAAQREAGFRPPLDVIDGAARVYDPIVRGVGGERLSGLFLKDYRPVDW